jgi:hypothetical protein
VLILGVRVWACAALGFALRHVDKRRLPSVFTAVAQQSSGVEHS